MLAILGTLLSGVLSGGATGLIGVLIQRFADYKNRQLEIEVVKLNHANALALAGMETERSRRRAEADEQIAETDLDAREIEADSRSLVASYGHDRAAYTDASIFKMKGWIGSAAALLLVLVDFMRGVLRPGMTMYLAILVSFMYWAAMDLLKTRGVEVFTNDQLLLIVTQVIATILYCFTTCTVWWFGTRPPKKGGDK